MPGDAALVNPAWEGFDLVIAVFTLNGGNFAFESFEDLKFEVFPPDLSLFLILDFGESLEIPAFSLALCVLFIDIGCW